MIKPVLLALASFAVSAGAIAAAQNAPAGGRGLMRADGNGDGAITRDEFLAQATERFDRMDLNRDGKLDATERQQVGQRLRGTRGDLPPPPAAPEPQ